MLIFRLNNMKKVNNYI